MKTLTFKNVITEFLGYVGNISSARIDMFKSGLRRELRKAYRQGYEDAQKINEEKDYNDATTDYYSPRRF